MKLLKTSIIKGKIECITGMRIGGSAEAIEIGGIDNPVIKHPVNNEPYIPGSSLKGKMRSQMEKIEGKVNEKPCGCADKGCMVCRVFGPHNRPKHDLGPTRILVRDAMLSDESRQEMIRIIQEGKSYIEIKTENIIVRTTGVANHPRTQERVPAGAKFDFEIVVQVFDIDLEKDVIDFVKKALKSVENSYLGSSGSRGYGQVHFTKLTLDGEEFKL
ncbi:CRISPR-associated protein, Csm3 family [Desulforamulus reducens MI-1]|uniref:CRISPR system Cms endoribonuclease Csm3 n=1 Tax=Desulforamulus reducens (strain ATCC BAA-1160 / DSM 100696 / MI-1) TaxID=349161 RepID=A4J504_DESRM|nr:type III-A CRISPR-associated RAMP protein Csm3 [Desulforamulus reducens]ABO50157.1 CRISPR-associated protein, Csm3 family [Desulforamulus reducens MI-1]